MIKFSRLITSDYLLCFLMVVPLYGITQPTDRTTNLDLFSLVQPVPQSLKFIDSGLHPKGPFIKQNKPIFSAENVDFPAEDPYVWYQDNCYYKIVKEMKSIFTDAVRSLVLFSSLDGLDWKLAKNPLVSDLNIHSENGTTQKLEALERPQLFFVNGKMEALLCAVNETQGHSYNVQIPLKLLEL